MADDVNGGTLLVTGATDIEGVVERHLAYLTVSEKVSYVYRDLLGAHHLFTYVVIVPHRLDIDDSQRNSLLRTDRDALVAATLELLVKAATVEVPYIIVIADSMLALNRNGVFGHNGTAILGQSRIVFREYTDNGRCEVTDDALRQIQAVLSGVQ